MSAFTAEEFLRITRQFYPVVEAPGMDPDSFLLTPEFQRWRQRWDEAVNETRPWESLLEGLRTELPGQDFGAYTPAYMAGGYVLLVYLRKPLPDGVRGHRLVRVAGAISLLAPLYFVYGTVEHLTPGELDDASSPPGRKWARRAGEWVRKADRPPAHPSLFLEPTQEMEPSAEVMGRHIESTLGYHRFPLELASVSVPDIRVPYLHHEQPTLLNALFLDRLEHLP